MSVTADRWPVRTYAGPWTEWSSRLFIWYLSIAESLSVLVYDDETCTVLYFALHTQIFLMSQWNSRFPEKKTYSSTTHPVFGMHFKCSSKELIALITVFALTFMFKLSFLIDMRHRQKSEFHSKISLPCPRSASSSSDWNIHNFTSVYFSLKLLLIGK